MLLFGGNLAGEVLFAASLGGFARAFGYPVVPQGHARIRCQVSAAHTREDLDFAVESFKKVGRRVGLLK